MKYFYALQGRALGPVDEDDLFKLYRVGQLNDHSFIIAENGTDWAEFGTVFTHAEARNTAETKDHKTTHLFTLSRTGPIEVKILPIKSKTERAFVLEDFAQLPDGTQRRVIMRGEQSLPTTPAEALRQFIKAQKNKIQELTDLLNKERTKLREAEKLLLTHEVVHLSKVEDVQRLTQKEGPPSPPSVSPAQIAEAQEQSSVTFPKHVKRSRHVF